MPRNAANGGFSDEDRKKLEAVFNNVNLMSDSMGKYKTMLRKAFEVIDKQAKHICYLNSQINLTNYRIDAQNQYGRKESLKVLKLDSKLHGTDPVKIMTDIVNEIEAKAKDKNGCDVKINMKEEHIQRCHFLGESKNKLICKFIPYSIRMKILLNKKVINGAREGKYKDVFIVEDLTPMRARLLWYMKKKCTTKFSILHTRDGVIKVKKEGRDADGDPWLSIRNPDDLFEHLDENDKFDVDLFNSGLHGFKLLPDISDSGMLEEMLELMRDADE